MPKVCEVYLYSCFADVVPSSPSTSLMGVPLKFSRKSL